MSIKEPNEFIITKLIIEQILANQADHEKSIKSVDIISDLFIDSVLNQNIFREQKYFEIEESLILDDEFYDAIKNVCFEFKVNEPSLTTIKNFFSQNESKKFTHEVPYEYITHVIYKRAEEVDYTIVDDKLTSIATAISNKITPYDDYDKKVLEKVFRKFRRHLLLSIYQKSYITKITKENAVQAGDLAKEAKDVATTAKDTSDKAKKLSEKARLMYDNMMVNYITILGIFASIIITVFGGINLTNATVKLIDSNHDLPVMVFVISFLMIGFISILIVLITWISSLRNESEYRSAVKWWILLGFGILSAVSALYLKDRINVSDDCQIGYYTCVHMENLNKL